jgi:hypothetical protein
LQDGRDHRDRCRSYALTGSKVVDQLQASLDGLQSPAKIRNAICAGGIGRVKGGKVMLNRGEQLRAITVTSNYGDSLLNFARCLA